MQTFIVQLFCVLLLLCCGCSKRTYTDYSHSSGFDRTQIDSTTLENLEVLGRVWGYVKYHHPAFSGDKYDLDCELFELLPQVADAEPAERNRILVSWIDGFGKFKTAPKKYDSILACDSLSDYRTDIGWIRDTVKLGAELSERLVRLRIADRKKNYYLWSLAKQSNSSIRNSCFANEKPYAELSDPDYGYRLLSVFRFWNMIEYFFPTKYLTDKDWNEVLPEYIGRMVHPVDGNYRKEAWRMIAEINDNHAQGNRVELFGMWRAPLDIGFVEDRLIVISPDTVPIYYDRQAAFEVGDEIIAVNRHPVDYYRSQVREFVPCSNDNDILAATADIILRSPTNRQCWVRYLRNGIPRDTLLSGMALMEGKFKNTYLRQNIKAYKSLDDSIGYIYPGKYSTDNLGEITRMMSKTKGLIVDMRCYPTPEFLEFMGKYIVPDGIDAPFRPTYPIFELPGVFHAKLCAWATCKEDKYPHPIVVLVYSGTQSAAETSVQWMQSNSYVKVIGSQSAGANGDISFFVLPDGIKCCFSGLGWYYPDGWCVQRQGVKIDYEVRPTIAGVLAGRDEVLETAVKILKSKTEEPENL